MQIFATIMAALIGSLAASTATVIGGVAVGAASTGGCYLWWRRRKSRARQS
jgi:uncharacterized iron-regulated membrane protein